MKSIKSKDINLGIILIIFFIIFLSLGISFRRILLLLAGTMSILGYLVLDKKRLRCPSCGGFENLERLSQAKKKDYYCRHCGSRIEISK